jgi:hypothetical protein
MPANRLFRWTDVRHDDPVRRRLFMHELFHRVQPGLGLLVAEPTFWDIDY